REANTDALTKLANRRNFDWELSRSTEVAMRENGALTLLMIDIDFFKNFNDRFGHQVGDIILKFVAKRLVDSIGNSQFAARYGGEEFAVILTDEWLDAGVAIADQIRAAICANRIHLRRRDLDVGTITISIGAAEYRPGEAVAELVHRADRALYAAKQGGRNRVVSELDLADGQRESDLTAVAEEVVSA
ncbi:MAG: GGDEF domain-containing protein, partial [Pseudomonadota bacterium]